MLKISKWFNNFQAPAVLMIDDLSDSYIELYQESYKNDWGYLCDSDESSYYFLQKELLDVHPDIKITFFSPYLKHNVINENSQYKFKKFDLGERQEYIDFLIKLNKQGHEIAHHGSNHGEYIDESISSTVNNWKHEWELFENIDEGVNITLEGVKRFKEICDIDVVGGKYCGYLTNDNSQIIIDKCNFLYWCDKVNFLVHDFNENFFGKNNIISFPTNYRGNSFVRLSYKTGKKKRDNVKSITKYLQPFYNIISYIQLYKLYKNKNIISIQEHYSPSTTAGTAQALNIDTDIKSLKKIFNFLKRLSIWYATCKEIATYIYVRENCQLIIENDELIIYFTNDKRIKDGIISIVNEKAFEIKSKTKSFLSKKHNGLYVVNLPVLNNKNFFKLKEFKG